MEQTIDPTQKKSGADASTPTAREQTGSNFIFRLADVSEEPLSSPPSPPSEKSNAYAPETVFRFNPIPLGNAPGAVAETLPRHITTRFQQLVSQFQTFPLCEEDPRLCLHPNSQAIAAIREIIKKSRHEALTWEDFDRMEIAMVHVTPAIALSHQAWELRNRYREAVGPVRYRLYEKSKPADWNDASVPDADLRADMEQMTSEVQAERVLLPLREQARARNIRVLGQQILWLCAACVLAFIFTQMMPVPPELAPALFLLAAMSSGALGSLVALSDRMGQKGWIGDSAGTHNPQK